MYLFPFGEAKDRSWLTRKIGEAFNDSSALWLELGAPPAQKRLNDLYDELGHEPQGRTFFDALEPRTRARALRHMNALGISHQSVAPLRPWLAYYTFVAAFDTKFGHSEGLTKSGPEQTPPEYVLAGRAREAQKPINVELTMEAHLRRLASMSDHLQSEYLEWLFDWFDDERQGLNRDRFNWMEGRLVSRAIVRMRRSYPDLYEYMDGQRNRWWARKIGTLLSQGGTCFAAIGQDHFADPQGIQTQLLELGVVTSAELSVV